MKKYKVLQDNSRWGEIEVSGEHGERLILCDKHRVYSDDYNSLSVWNVDCLDEVAEIPERIYQMSYMPDAYSLIIAYVNEKAAMAFMSANALNVIRRDSHKIKEGIKAVLDKLEWANVPEEKVEV